MPKEKRPVNKGSEVVSSPDTGARGGGGPGGDVCGSPRGSLRRGVRPKNSHVEGIGTDMPAPLRGCHVEKGGPSCVSRAGQTYVVKNNRDWGTLFTFRFNLIIKLRIRVLMAPRRELLETTVGSREVVPEALAFRVPLPLLQPCLGCRTDLVCSSESALRVHRLLL